MPSETVAISISSHRKLYPVELLDRDFRLIARAFGSLKAEVPPGLYLARCDAGGPTAERLVNAVAKSPVEVIFSDREVALMPSAAPVLGSVTQHEFYSEPASALATQAPYRVFGSGARLALFASRLDFLEIHHPNGTRIPIHWEGVRLLDGEGREILAFPGEEIRSDDDRRYGRAGFTVDLDPGGYFIEWPATNPDDPIVILQPVWLAPQWTTRVFASALGGRVTPRRDSVSIHMSRLGQALRPWDEKEALVDGATELAMASLRTGRQLLGDQQLGATLDKPFCTPMLALLGGYMLLQGPAPDEKSIDAIIERLRKEAANHPDLYCLECMADDQFASNHSNRDRRESDFPPMLRDGVLGLDRVDWNYGGDSALQGTARLARLRLLSEGPWTMMEHPVARELGTAQPLSTAEVAATEEARSELAGYLGKLGERFGIEPFRRLNPDQLQWAGLSRRDAIAVFEHELYSLEAEAAGSDNRPPKRSASKRVQRKVRTAAAETGRARFRLLFMTAGREEQETLADELNEYLMEVVRPRLETHIERSTEETLGVAVTVTVMASAAELKQMVMAAFLFARQSGQELGIIGPRGRVSTSGNDSRPAVIERSMQMLLVGSKIAHQNPEDIDAEGQIDDEGEMEA